MGFFNFGGSGPDQGQKQEEYWNGPDEHGFRPMNDPNYGPIPEPFRSNGMTKAALACGILSLVTMLFGYGLLFGLLGILFACLSRGRKMPKQAKIGLGMSIASIAVFAFSLVTLITALTASGAWPKLIEQARVTDFSDSTSVEDLERTIYESLMRSLLPFQFTDNSGGIAGGTGEGAGGSPVIPGAGAQSGTDSPDHNSSVNPGADAQDGTDSAAAPDAGTGSANGTPEGDPVLI